jgi:hypothetical protein
VTSRSPRPPGVPAPIRLLVVIVNYKVTDLTIDCLASIAPEIDAVAGTVIGLCENGSGGDAAERLRSAVAALPYRDRIILRVSGTNLGFTGGNNLIIREALDGPQPPDYLLLLNPDTLVQVGAFAALVSFMDANPHVGVAGSRLENRDGSAQRSAFRFHSIGGELNRAMHLGLVSRLLARWVVAVPPPAGPCRVDWVSGASLMVRRQVLADVGLLDDGLFTYFDDADMCRRARRAGWETWYVPASRVRHLGGAATGVDGMNVRPGRRPDYWFQARRRYYLKHHGPLYTAAADAALLAGLACWRLRRGLQRKPDRDPPRLLWDHLRHSVFCTGFKVRPVPNPDAPCNGKRTESK